MAQSPPPLPVFTPANTNQTIYSIFPGTMSSDGFDEVCLLAQCCPNWVSRSGTTTLVTNTAVNCSDVVCPNACRFACDRSFLNSGAEACTTNCSSNVDSSTQAFVFIDMNGADGFGHVGFGFLVAPGVYAYGSLENPNGDAVIAKGQYNGYWFQTGSAIEMFCAFLAKPYNPVVKEYVSGPAYACSAIFTAEQYYTTGYCLLGNNCLNVVYTVLTNYGVPDLPSPDSPTLVPNVWYGSLSTSEWQEYSFPVIDCAQ